MERVGRVARRALGAARGIGHEDERRPRLDAAEPREGRHARSEPALALRDEGQPVALVLARDEAQRVDAPRLVVAPHEAQLGERDAHLDRPPLAVDGDGGVPHGVPRLVRPGVVEDDLVALDAGRRDLEPDAGQAVAPRVEEDREAVGVGGVVAPRQPAADEVGLAVEQPRPHVEGPVVVEEAELGLLAGRLALVRVALQEAGVRGGRPPRGLVEPAVDRDGARRPGHLDLGGGRRLRPRRGRAARASRGKEEEECEREPASVHRSD